MELCSSATAILRPKLHHVHSFIPSSTTRPPPPPPSVTFKNSPYPATLTTHHNPFRCTAAASPVTSVESTKPDVLPAELTVSQTAEPDSRVRLSVEVPPQVCQDCYQRVLREFMKQAKVPGFRPGKSVPENILIDYVGKKHVLKATVESILKRTLPHAMSSVTGNALQDSVQIVTKFSEMEETYKKLQSLRYEVGVDVAPEVKWNPEDGYKNLKIVVEIDGEITAQRACEHELKRRHKSLGVLRIVTDRGLQVGDVVVVDISAKTIDQDESNVSNIPSAESTGFQFDTEDGDKVLPGFLDSIIGIQGGETKSFPLYFPDDWRQEHLRGVHAQFTVECKELFYRDLPPFDDSIADKLVPGCTTLEEIGIAIADLHEKEDQCRQYRSSRKQGKYEIQTQNTVKDLILQKCVEMEQTAREQATDNAILDQLRKIVDVEVPRSLFEEQGRQFYGAQLLEIQANMKLSDEQLATLSSPKSVNQFLNSQRENIINVIKQNLAVGDIYKRENLQFATEELVKEVENSIQEFKKQNQEYDEERVTDQVQEILEGAKVLEWLKERADIQYITR